MSAQKIGGRFVTTDEHEGKGTVINIADTSARRGSGSVPIPPTTCCDRDCDEISTIDVTLSVDADFHGACGTGSRSSSFTWNFVRIDKATAFTPGLFEFKLYFDTETGGCCPLVFSTFASVYSHDWGKADSICETGDFRFPSFVSTLDETCTNGTLNLVDDNHSVVSARFGGVDDSCNEAPCTESTVNTVDDYASDIPITTCDISDLIGTYTSTHTDSSDPNVDMTITAQLVIG